MVNADISETLLFSIASPPMFNAGFAGSNLVLLFNIMNPDALKNDNKVDFLFNVIKTLMFNADSNVVLWFNVVNPDTFQEDTNVAWLLI